MNEEWRRQIPPFLPPWYLYWLLTFPAPLSPLTTMDWFLVSRSLLISRNAFCPTANIWGGSSLIDMDKLKTNEKYHFTMGDVFFIKANEKRCWKMKERWWKCCNAHCKPVILQGYWPWWTILSILTLSINFSIQTYRTLNHPQTLPLPLIFIFPPNFSSFNNFKIKQICRRIFWSN